MATNTNYVTEKVIRLGTAVADNIRQRVNFYYPATTTALAPVVANSFYVDGSGNTYFLTTVQVDRSYAYTAGVAGALMAGSALVRWRTYDALPAGVDGIGLPQRVYVPDIGQIAIDTNAAATAGLGTPAALQTWITSEVAATGVRVEEYDSQGPLAAATAFTGTLTASWDNLQYPMLITS